jgi:adenosylcobalamin-dependent ribonucleoside-triphosphate reductase
MKFLPPGRGLWAMGSSLTTVKKIYASLNNCAFVSTEKMKDDPVKPFTFLMDMSMLGVGVGFDTKGAETVIVKGSNNNRNIETFEIPDTREGWVDSLRLLLESFFNGSAPIKFDYSKIRKAGLPIKGFGGLSSGPEPLITLHEDIIKTLSKEIGLPISLRSIVDIQNMIGKCVVAGNVRRTAEIVFGEHDNEEYLDLKNYKKNPDRKEYGWTSNNSIFAKLGMDYSNVSERTKINGEPGFIWLDNIQKYSKMNGVIDNKDHRASGANPCSEQSLESYELCCLVETFPHAHDNLEDYLKTLKYAYLYAKTVTLGETHWAETNRVLLRNRRIGCSMSGIAQFISYRGIHELKSFMKNGYNYIQELDQKYSDWLAIPLSIKTTSIKPSGTVSLLRGATPGMHYPESRFYIRRVRLGINSELIKPLKKAGYKIESSEDDPKNTSIVEIPIDIGKGIRTVDDFSLWEQLSLASFIQKYWADNQVSCTISFDPKTEGNQIKHALTYFQYQLKGISFLPRLKKGAYPQMPYEKITEKEYKLKIKNIKNIEFNNIKQEKAEVEVFCDSDKCEILKS